MTSSLSVLTEFDQTWQSIRLSPHETEALQGASLRWADELRLPGLPLEVVRDGPDARIRSRYVTGFVRVGDHQIEIRPKFLTPTDAEASNRWRLALWNALRLARADVDVGGPIVGRATKGVSFVDLLAESFLESMRRGSARGLPRQYTEERLSLPSLRGTLDTSRPTELILRPGYLPCRVSVLNEQTPLNRLFRWTAKQLAELAVSPRRARSLLDVYDSLGHVSSSPPSRIAVQRDRLGPQHAALGPAREIGLLLLEGHSRDPHPEAGGVHGILWVTHLLYEDTVRALVMRAAGGVGLRALKKRIAVGSPIGNGSPLSTIPDVLVYRGSDVVLVLDAKYKVYSRSPDADDIYQVIAGGKVADCEEVGLVYPSDSSGVQSWGLEGTGQPHRLAAISLDLLSLADDARGNALAQELEGFLTRYAAIAA